MQSHQPHIEATPEADIDCAPGFFRRIAAMTYDAFLLLAVLFVATVVALPFNSGETFTSDQVFFKVYLFVISFVFFAWFWTHGGQTLGLRAWKSKVVDENGGAISWQQALIRFCCALLSWSACGFGFIWILIDKNNLAWHDKLSKTRIILTNPEP